ncbi:hypothetical protein Hanom_Chr00s000002g01600621 [Helianthus anomalus]
MEGAKLSATIAMLKIKMQMAKEQRLTELGDEDEPEEVLALVGGGNESRILRRRQLVAEARVVRRRLMMQRMCRLHNWAMMDISRRGRSPFFMIW